MLLKGIENGFHYYTRTKANSIVRKLMLNAWYESIFAEFKERLYTAVKLVHTERNDKVQSSLLKSDKLM